MNTGLWILQIALFVKFITTAINHGIRHEMDEMKDAISRMGDNAKPLLKIISVIMTLCAIGLIVPGVLNVLQWITPVSAGVLALMSLLSIVFHIRYSDNPKVYSGVILFVLTALVAYGKIVL